RIQATLDQVDVRLGRPPAAAAFTAPPAARTVAAALFFSLVLAGQFGLALLPVAATLVRPTAALMAATGAMALARALLAIGDTTLPITWAGVAGSVIAAFVLLAMAIKTTRALAKRETRRPLVEIRVEKAALLLLCAAAAIFGAALIQQAPSAPRELIGDAAT